MLLGDKQSRPRDCCYVQSSGCHDNGSTVRSRVWWTTPRQRSYTSWSGFCHVTCWSHCLLDRLFDIISSGDIIQRQTGEMLWMWWRRGRLWYWSFARFVYVVLVTISGVKSCYHFVERNNVDLGLIDLDIFALCLWAETPYILFDQLLLIDWKALPRECLFKTMVFNMYNYGYLQRRARAYVCVCVCVCLGKW